MDVRIVLNDRRKFVGILSILLVGGFLAVSLISYRVAHDSISEQIAVDTLPLTSDNIYSEIQRDLLRPIFISSVMAQDTFLRDWALAGEQEPERLRRYLQEIQNRYDTVTSYFISEKSRNYYHPTGIVKKVAEDAPEDAWYFRTRDLPAGEEYEVNIDTDTADRASTTVFVNYRVYDYGGEFIGITGVGLAVELVKQLVETYQRRYGRQVYFIDRQGEVALHGDGFEGPLTIHQRPGLKRIATQILTSPSGSFSFRRGNRKVYLNSRLVPEFKWYLMVEQEEDPAERRLLKTLLVNLLLSLLVTGGVLLLAYLTIGGYQRRLEQMAATDKLTGTANRQAFEILFEQTVRSAKRKEASLSVVMLDIDRFKQVNDTYGHLAGDLVLRTVANLIRRAIRESDTVCRWGGEEFLLLLPECDLDHARKLAERIRSAVEARSIATGLDRVTVTASLGVAQYGHDELPAELLSRADRALYEAKGQGRNRVTLSKR
ncbi:MAG: sensor domain-containing diguanylate cyclase [Candidatus Thiodiazotropha sp. (ex Dulcina madagascariensis)]|nr:sensor domain-containing diguanylate cyclase [Candidatus Thiodiazotropha sp. (ex Dulcina madagascariensis)]MCU7928888.1 sensor domain-containing diguanylate cyclase [Candidatus Thiodiazotropha sp. (ex Dulcina madagascariensis)]